jgi:hypothetical protein
MLDTYVKNRGMTKTIIHKNNHNTINETNWDADYDGSVANVSLDLSTNGRNKHLDFKLTNDDLANMLSVPSVNQPIHKRLKMDFRKPESFRQIFLELDLESDSDSSSVSDSELEHMKNNKKVSTPIQELLTHMSSPKSNEEFIMPFQDYSLNSFEPVIKISHRPSSKSKSSKKSKRSSTRSRTHKFNSHKFRHHNYPSTRKSSKRRTSRRS